MSTTPNMNLVLPDPTVTPGPEWAEELNTALEVVDSHDHTSSFGTKVPVAGLDINEDLSLASHRATDVYSSKMVNQPTALSGALNANSFHTVNGDAYFTNSGGTPVQLTEGNSVKASVIIPANPLMPSGTVIDFAGGTAPVGFFECDGSAVSRTTYSDLFAVLGVTYGVGDGTTTFNIPDARGRTIVAKGTYTDSVLGSVSRTLSQIMGAAAHVLTIAQMPTHTHIQTPHSHQITGVNSGSSLFGKYIDGSAADTQSSEATAAINQPEGGSTSHNIMQPSLVLTKMIKY